MLNFYKQKGSNPYLPDHQALHDLTKILKRLKQLSGRESMPEMVKQMFERIAQETDKTFDVNKAEDFIEEELPASLGRLMKAMTQTTFSPTNWVQANTKDGNTSLAFQLTIDCRMLPSVTEEELTEWLDDALKETDITYRLLSFSQGYESNLKPQQMEQIETVLNQDLPGT